MHPASAAELAAACICISTATAKTTITLTRWMSEVREAEKIITDLVSDLNTMKQASTTLDTIRQIPAVATAIQSVDLQSSSENSSAWSNIIALSRGCAGVVTEFGALVEKIDKSGDRVKAIRKLLLNVKMNVKDDVCARFRMKLQLFQQSLSSLLDMVTLTNVAFGFDQNERLHAQTLASTTTLESKIDVVTEKMQRLEMLWQEYQSAQRISSNEHPPAASNEPEATLTDEMRRLEVQWSAQQLTTGPGSERTLVNSEPGDEFSIRPQDGEMIRRSLVKGKLCMAHLSSISSNSSRFSENATVLASEAGTIMTLPIGIELTSIMAFRPADLEHLDATLSQACNSVVGQPLPQDRQETIADWIPPSLITDMAMSPGQQMRNAETLMNLYKQHWFRASFESAADKIEQFREQYMPRFSDEQNRKLLESVGPQYIANFSPEAGLLQILCECYYYTDNIAALVAKSEELLVRELMPDRPIVVWHEKAEVHYNFMRGLFAMREFGRAKEAALDALRWIDTFTTEAMAEKPAGYSAAIQELNYRYTSAFCQLLCFIEDIAGNFDEGELWYRRYASEAGHSATEIDWNLPMIAKTHEAIKSAPTPEKAADIAVEFVEKVLHSCDTYTTMLTEEEAELEATDLADYRETIMADKSAGLVAMGQTTTLHFILELPPVYNCRYFFWLLHHRSALTTCRSKRGNYTPLQIACVNTQTSIIQPPDLLCVSHMLRFEDALLDDVNADNTTAIMLAAIFSSPHTVNILIRFGADLRWRKNSAKSGCETRYREMTDRPPRHVIEICAFEGWLDPVRRMASDLRVGSVLMTRAVRIAVRQRHGELARSMIDFLRWENKVDTMVTDDLGDDLLILALQGWDEETAEKVLIARARDGLELNTKGREGYSADYYAQAGEMTKLRRLLEPGQNEEMELWNQVPETRKLLSDAMEADHEQIGKFLCADPRIKDVNFKRSVDEWPLMLAVQNAQDRFVKMLLESKKASVDLKDSFGYTARDYVQGMLRLIPSRQITQGPNSPSSVTAPVKARLQIILDELNKHSNKSEADIEEDDEKLSSFAPYLLRAAICNKNSAFADFLLDNFDPDQFNFLLHGGRPHFLRSADEERAKDNSFWRARQALELAVAAKRLPTFNKILAAAGPAIGQDTMLHNAMQAAVLQTRQPVGIVLDHVLRRLSGLTRSDNQHQARVAWEAAMRTCCSEVEPWPLYLVIEYETEFSPIGGHEESRWQRYGGDLADLQVLDTADKLERFRQCAWLLGVQNSGACEQVILQYRTLENMPEWLIDLKIPSDPKERRALFYRETGELIIRTRTVLGLALKSVNERLRRRSRS